MPDLVKLEGARRIKAATEAYAYHALDADETKGRQISNMTPLDALAHVALLFVDALMQQVIDELEAEEGKKGSPPPPPPRPQPSEPFRKA